MERIRTRGRLRGRWQQSCQGWAGPKGVQSGPDVRRTDCNKGTAGGAEQSPSVAGHGCAGTEIGSTVHQVVAGWRVKLPPHPTTKPWYNRVQDLAILGPS